MKINIASSIIAVAIILLAIGCTNDPAAPNVTSANLQNDNGWHVSWFWDKDKDETSDFNPYTFYFRDNGAFEAVSSNATITGTWRTATDDGSQRLVLFISNNKPLSELNDDWVIVSMDENKISLKDDNDEHLEELHFEAK